MGAGHSAEGEGGAYASDPPAHDRRKVHSRRRRHSVDSVASYSSQNHVDRIRGQNFSAASCQDEGDFSSIKTCLFRRSSSNLDCPHKRPESVTSNTSSTRSRLRELVERKSSQEEHKTAAKTAVSDIQYFENPTETLEFDKPRNSLESKNSKERPKKRKQSKSKDKESGDNKNKKQEKYQSKLAEYYKLPVQLPQDEFYQHLTRSRAAEELLQKRFSNSDTEFNGSYGRLCKHKEAEGSNLRRSRSLAVIREETFTDLQIQNHAKSKRSQLIPRARLFDKPCFRDRLPCRAKYQTKEEVLESIYIDSTVSCFGDINRQTETENTQENRSETAEIVPRNESQNSRSVSDSWPNLNEEIKPTHQSEDSIGHSRNPSEIDSLDSNYVRKHYNFEAHLKNNKDSSTETERSEATSERSCGDQNTENEDKNTTKSFANDSLSTSKSVKDNYLPETSVNEIAYDEISLKTTQSEIKEDFTRVPQSTSSKSSESKDEVDTNSIASENDGTVSTHPDSITSYISISIASSTDKSHKLEYLANSLAEKIDEYCDSQFHENNLIPSQALNSEHIIPETEPIYTKVNKKTFADIKRDSLLRKDSDCSLFSNISKKQNEVYVSNTYIECDTYSTKNNHASKNITTEPFVTTLIENQYYSLPDINISKCLRKSEKIDAQLRKEDPEDIFCENTYEEAHNNYQDKALTNNENYGQLNKTQKVNSCSIDNYYQNYQSKDSKTYTQNFTKLEDDLKSIITIESSICDDKDLSYFQSDSHQNEREINEIEGTIRNNKVITKSESLKLKSNSYQPTSKLPKSLSNDNINNTQERILNTGIKKHYSSRQRDPIDDDIHRLPSPSTVQQNSCQKEPIQSLLCNDIKNHSLISRVQSFKTSAESNITIVPLSGHQTIVIDPPLTQEVETNINQQAEDTKHSTVPTISENNIPQLKTEVFNNYQSFLTENKEIKENNNNSIPVEGLSLSTAKKSFFNIKLNKVVKTTIPKLNKVVNTTVPKFNAKNSDNNSCIQYNFEKSSTRFVIEDKSDKEFLLQKLNKASKNMTRPQVLQVVDSKNKKLNTSEKTNTRENTHVENNHATTVINANSELDEKKNSFNVKDNIRVDCKPESCAKEKLNNAIKTDIEYQEKLHSVKNYWSKLIDKSPDFNDDTTITISETNDEDKVIDEKNIQKDDDKNSLPDISVGSIIKSLESVKIVDSIRKIRNTKLKLWKDETEKVKSDSEIEEATVLRLKDCENNVYEKPKFDKNCKQTAPDLSRDTPEIEIVELSSNDNHNKKTQATLIKAKGFENGNDEFDHVRYKVMKSELFKNSMIANYRKEAQFDGLLQYLQDYSFQELLVNNNIVIIEPVRTKIEPLSRKNNTDTCKIAPTLLKKSENSTFADKSKNVIRRHFFYHPIRVNKEIIEEELPNPDTVKKVRNLFEDTLKMKSPLTHDPPLIEETGGLTRRARSYRSLTEENKNTKNIGRKKVIRQLTIDTNLNNKKWDNASLSSGVSSGDLSSNNDYDTEGLSPYSHKNLKDNAYSSSEEYLCDSVTHDFCCESQYVSPDILKKIRECGTSVTYYGGKVLNSKTGTTVSPMTKAIMEEIKGLQKKCSRDCYLCQTKCRGDKCLCLATDKHKKYTSNKHNSSTSSDSGNQDCEKTKRSESFPEFKFKLIKSNSCSSRLELTGSDECKNSRLKYRQPRTEDPPLVYDDENSVKNKISRLESYSKGIVKTPFVNKDNEDNKCEQRTKKQTEIKSPDKDIKIIESTTEENNSLAELDEVAFQRELESETKQNPDQLEKETTLANSFEKKFYYVNENLEPCKTTTGKFGEMVFEEFEVLESCYDSLNSNKSLK